MTHPITIAGGGLAGLALGIALRRQDIPVVIHEAGSYPRHRVCGEFICGLKPGTAEALGIDDCLADALPCRTTGWFVAGRRIWERELPAPALGISRHRLDQRLVERFTALGGELRTGSRLRPEESSAPGTVWATGRRAARGSRWIGLKFHCSDFELEDDLELHLGVGGYMGVSRIEGGKVNICGLFRQRPNAGGLKTELPLVYMRASRLDNLAARVEASTLDFSSIVGVSRLSYRPAPADRQRFSLGDRLGLIPPFTGDGMAMAFQGAALAAAPLADYARGRLEWPQALDTARHGLRSAFGRRRSVARLLHPLILWPAAQALLATAATQGLLPFNFLFNLTH
jgi:flavin-dependent dehydrogenase